MLLYRKVNFFFHMTIFQIFKGFPEVISSLCYSFAIYLGTQHATQDLHGWLVSMYTQTAIYIGQNRWKDRHQTANSGKTEITGLLTFYSLQVYIPKVFLSVFVSIILCSSSQNQWFFSPGTLSLFTSLLLDLWLLLEFSYFLPRSRHSPRLFPWHFCISTFSVTFPQWHHTTTSIIIPVLMIPSLVLTSLLNSRPTSVRVW